MKVQICGYFYQLMNNYYLLYLNYDINQIESLFLFNENRNKNLN